MAGAGWRGGPLTSAGRRDGPLTGAGRRDGRRTCRGRPCRRVRLSRARPCACRSVAQSRAWTAPGQRDARRARAGPCLCPRRPGRRRVRRPFYGVRVGSRARLIHARIRVRQVDTGNRTRLHVRHGRDGLSVSQARQQRGLCPGNGERFVCRGSARYRACPGRTVVPVSVPGGILAGGARARVLSEWARAPVIGGGWGWHAIKIQARPRFTHNQRGCVQTWRGCRLRQAGCGPADVLTRRPAVPAETQRGPEPEVVVTCPGVGCEASKCQTLAVPSNKHRKATGHLNEFRFE